MPSERRSDHVGIRTLAVLFEREVAFYDVSDTTRTPVPIVSSFSTKWRHYRAEPLGVGVWTSMSARFMIDIDGDADVDFVELANEDSDVTDNVPGYTVVAIHPRELDGGFSPPVNVAASAILDDRAESPFIRVGTAEGAIIVRCVGFGPPCDPGPLTFQMLECAPE